MRSFIIFLLMVSPCLAVMPSAGLSFDSDSNSLTSTTPVSPSNITTINTSVLYTDAFYVADTEFISVAMTLDTTETVNVTVELQAAIEDSDGTLTWGSFYPACTYTFTGDTTVTWMPGHAPSDAGICRLKFGTDKFKETTEKIQELLGVKYKFSQHHIQRMLDARRYVRK